MRTHRRTPGVILRVAVLRLLGRLPTDRRGVENHVRSRHSGQTCSLWIPLIPAHQRRNPTELRIEGAETRIARREVKLLVEQRIFRDMHFPVQTGLRSIGIDHHRRVVIQPWRTLLEHGSHHHNPQLFGYPGKFFGGRPRDGLGQVKQLMLLALAAEILRAKQFLQAHNLRTFRGSFPHPLHSLGEIGFWLRRTGHLHQSDAKVFRGHKNHSTR